MFLTTLETEIKKVGHDIKVAAIAIEGAAAKVATALGKAEPIVNQILADADPAAATFAEFGEALAAKALALVGDAGAAVSSAGANLPLDATAIADAKALYAAMAEIGGKALVGDAPELDTAMYFDPDAP